ncbi:TerD family protein, partial [Klebsiella pneumoniae]|uniref:TerD family protein n=1 Tax=Klebsiella pneumoniae TaxID=573 RepID=UPI001D0F0D26
MSHLMFGLGWDPIKKKGFLGGLFGGNNSIDLDASCVLLDVNGKQIDTIWFRKLKSTCQSVIHSGDNLTG